MPAIFVKILFLITVIGVNIISKRKKIVKKHEEM